MSKNIVIRNSIEADIVAIQAIYEYEVLNGCATFDETPRSYEMHNDKRQEILSLGLPHLVVEIEGKVVGYSYATGYRGERSGYRYTIENSVFIDKDFRRMGIGKLLLGKLIELCEKGPWRQMVAVIGDSHNSGSIGLHTKLGFHNVGVLKNVGFKFGKWVDAVMMQRELGEGHNSLPQ